MAPTKRRFMLIITLITAGLLFGYLSFGPNVGQMNEFLNDHHILETTAPKEAESTNPEKAESTNPLINSALNQTDAKLITMATQDTINERIDSIAKEFSEILENENDPLKNPIDVTATGIKLRLFRYGLHH